MPLSPSPPNSPVYMPTTPGASPPSTPKLPNPSTDSHNYVLVFHVRTFCSVRQLQTALRRAKTPAIVSSIHTDREYMLVFDAPITVRTLVGIITRAFAVDADLFTTMPVMDSDDLRYEGAPFVDVARTIVIMRDALRDIADENRELRRALIRANAKGDALRLSLARSRKLRKARV